jgi:hypothetical protein
VLLTFRFLRGDEPSHSSDAGRLLWARSPSQNGEQSIVSKYSDRAQDVPMRGDQLPLDGERDVRVLPRREHPKQVGRDRRNNPARILRRSE